MRVKAQRKRRNCCTADSVHGGWTTLNGGEEHARALVHKAAWAVVTKVAATATAKRNTGITRATIVKKWAKPEVQKRWCWLRWRGC